MKVEWDSRKAAANLRKHGVDFADAATVLYDELSLRSLMTSRMRSALLPSGWTRSAVFSLLFTLGVESGRD